MTVKKKRRRKNRPQKLCPAASLILCLAGATLTLTPLQFVPRDVRPGRSDWANNAYNTACFKPGLSDGEWSSMRRNATSWALETNPSSSTAASTLKSWLLLFFFFFFLLYQTSSGTHIIIYYLRNCPQDCRRRAYLSLIRSTLTSMDLSYMRPPQPGWTYRLERIQRQSARSVVVGDNCSSEPGCVTD